MGLLDISQVTRSLITLIENHVQASTIWPPGQALSVVPDPPDSLTGDNTLGLYLYHIKEDPNNKNLMPVGNSQPPIRYTSMPILLYYQLSAHSGLSSPTGSFREQMMLGGAIKALHDFPVINDDTEINGIQVLTAPLIGGDNRLQIELRPVSADEAVSFWTAGSSPLRLACYYGVSVVMLEPEEIEQSAGPVINYNVFAFPQTRPFIVNSSNQLTFTIPGESSARRVTLQPAQIATEQRLQIDGVNFVSDDTRLQWSYSEWDAPQLIDPLDWAQQVSAERVAVVIQETLAGEILVPGVYSVSVVTVNQLQGTDGGTYDASNVSNATSVTIIPRLDNIGAPDNTGLFTVSGHCFEHAFIGEEAIQIFIGEQRLAEGTAGALAPGEFAVNNANSLEIRLPSDVLSGAVIPLRVKVNGAESAPNWLTLP